MSVLLSLCLFLVAYSPPFRTSLLGLVWFRVLQIFIGFCVLWFPARKNSSAKMKACYIGLETVALCEWVREQGGVKERERRERLCENNMRQLCTHPSLCTHTPKRLGSITQTPNNLPSLDEISLTLYTHSHTDTVLIDILTNIS